MTRSLCTPHPNKNKITLERNCAGLRSPPHSQPCCSITPASPCQVTVGVGEGWNQCWTEVAKVNWRGVGRSGWIPRPCTEAAKETSVREQLQRAKYQRAQSIKSTVLVKLGRPEWGMSQAAKTQSGQIGEGVDHAHYQCRNQHSPEYGRGVYGYIFSQWEL